MINKASVLESVKMYSDTLRNPTLDPFEISDVYSLFPITDTPEPRWPQPYPHRDRQGVYLIFDEAMKLLYVGKTSVNKTLRKCLAAYFSNDRDKNICRVKKQGVWSTMPSYLITIAVPNDASIEAPALEEYLLKSFGNELPDNKNGAG